MDKLEFRSHLDTVSRAGTIMLIALYGAGFLVVTFSNAMYGIVEFGLFRTRLLSAGVIFAIFLGLPFVEASRIFGLFGFNRIGFPKLTRSDEFLFFVTAAWGSTFLMRFVVGDFDLSLRVVLLWLGFPALSSAVFVARGFKVLPKIVAFVIVVIFAVVSLVALILVQRWSVVGLLGWFMAVGWLTYQMDSSMRDPEELKQVSWVLVFLNVLFVFGYFASVLYPRIEPIFGGGHPTDIVLQFTTTSPVDSSTKMEVWLVDETDAGYYFTRTREDRKAIFVPRSLVSVVYFQAGNTSR
jgi:hypothetical protein